LPEATGMSGFTRNVYETFDRIHHLLGNSDHPDDATAMDRAEVQIQINNLVEGLVELLQHAATHRLISLDIGDYDHELEPEEIGVYRDDSDEPAANHTVAIRVPEDYLPEDESAISEAVAAFDLGTVETSADLAVAAIARMRLLANDDAELNDRFYARWAEVAADLLPRVLPALRRLDAAGLLKLYDARTGTSFVPIGIGNDERDAMVEIAFTSDAPSARRSGRKTTVTPRSAAGSASPPGRKKST
jgi:hypothetical protein